MRTNRGGISLTAEQRLAGNHNRPWWQFRTSDWIGTLPDGTLVIVCYGPRGHRRHALGITEGCEVQIPAVEELGPHGNIFVVSWVNPETEVEVLGVVE